MQSQLTVRLPEDLEEGILGLAKRLHLKRSDIVRMALEKFLAQFQGEGEEEWPYRKVKRWIGAVSTGIEDLGEAHREHLLKRIKKYA
jgi:predicted transcriptional regulator